MTTSCRSSLVGSAARGAADPTVVVDPTEVERTAGGRAFTCTRVTFGWGEGAERVELTAWLSSDVKVSGLVALVVTRGGAEVLRGEVSGWGREDAARDSLGADGPTSTLLRCTPWDRVIAGEMV